MSTIFRLPRWRPRTTVLGSTAIIQTLNRRGIPISVLVSILISRSSWNTGRQRGCRSSRTLWCYFGKKSSGMPPMLIKITYDHRIVLSRVQQIRPVHVIPAPSPSHETALEEHRGQHVQVLESVLEQVFALAPSRELRCLPCHRTSPVP